MYAGNIEGVKVFDNMSAKHTGSLVITGSGLYRSYAFLWKAIVTSEGWNVTIITEAGERGSYQGCTFNIILEVIRAVKTLLT